MVNRTEKNEEYQEYARWLGRIEKRAILPLKWIILVTTLFIWLWGTNWVLPSPGVFALFLLYTMFNIALCYFFYFNRLELSQIKSVCYASYFADILFVTAIVYSDIRFHFGTAMQSDFYILYFLLIMRGFALFRTPAENMFMSALIALLFVLTIAFQEPSWGFISERGFVLKFILIWMVALMSWFIVENINQQKTELIKIKEKLMNTQHLAHLGEIMANLAHELNNPIGIITTCSEYLLRSSPSDDMHREDFETIRNEALRCEKIIAELMSYTKPAVQKIEYCRLEQINDEVLELLFHQQKDENIVIHKEYEPDLPPLLADTVQLKQALLNIYINAREAIGNKGKIDSIIKRGKLVEGDLIRDSLQIIIRDNGKGFRRDVLERAFDPFFTTRANGTGLGLTITKQIIEAHHGTIKLRNISPHGSEIEINLPISHKMKNGRS
ncbi:hypothetical protein J7M23_01935 [Candidatus Sumerlaeota bacterium]|nr:hypothetical protein [Candidatus Sumerlaeota bacterium]